VSGTAVIIVAMPAGTVLTTRALNRALLARQHLLERAVMPATAMIEHLVGMQAQVPQQPYVALWSRLRDFDPAELEAHFDAHEVVRMGVMRSTLHLLTTRDALRIRPSTQSVLERVFRSTSFARDIDGIDREALLAHGRALVEEQPRSGAELAAALRERWPGYSGPSMSQAARYLLPMIQPPPRGLWTRTGRATTTTIEHWLGRHLPEAEPPDELVLRYLGAFGPATVADARTWSWLTGLREVFERLRPQLATFRDENGRELYDLPDAPRPHPDTPAPPRFLPEYDNLGLSHADRSRVIPAPVAARLTGWVGTFLADGFVHGQWRVDQAKNAATLVLQPFLPLEGETQAAVVAEGERLLDFMARPGGGRLVEFGVARKPEALRAATTEA